MPCYNEQDNEKLFYDEAVKAFGQLHISYELIFINDGSADNTLNVLHELCASQHGTDIRVLSFSRNFGKEAAIYAGLKACKGDYAVLIDADMQQPPSTACEMFEIIRNNPEYDCVTAYQEQRSEGKVLSLFKKAFYKLINAVADTPFVSGASDFRLMSRKVVDAILSVTEYHRFSKGIFSWVGFNTFYMPYKALERANGKSTWSFFKLVKYAIEGIVGYTTAPLKLSMFVGMGSAFSSLIYALVVIIKRLAFGVDVPGYASIVVLLLLLGGLQLF